MWEFNKGKLEACNYYSTPAFIFLFRFKAHHMRAHSLSVPRAIRAYSAQVRNAQRDELISA